MPCLDLTSEENCKVAVRGAAEVYNLAADMGGMGFIERFRIMCLRSILINTHLIESAYNAGVDRYFYASSACAYNTKLQEDPNCRALKERTPTRLAERGYGWEKLVSEMFCQEYTAERGMKTAIARFHNVYGPWGTWDGGREKAPAAMCRKSSMPRKRLHDIRDMGRRHPGPQFHVYRRLLFGSTRSCTARTLTPSHQLGTSEMISINHLADLAEESAASSSSIITSTRPRVWLAATATTP